MKRVFDETRIIEDSETEDGNRYYSERHIIEVEKEPSGIKDALAALAMLSSVGVFIYITWMVAFNVVGTPKILQPAKQTTSLIKGAIHVSS